MTLIKATWTEALATLERAGEPRVLVTVLQTRGSTPRDSGTKMVVSAEGAWGTIGGGHLEYQVLALAADMLHTGQNSQRVEKFPLGPKLGQCCGGHAEVLLECFAGAGLQLALFGAGHVGRAVATVFGQLPCRLHWVDSRAGEFPDACAPNTHRIVSDDPVAEVANLPPGCYYLVMTHEHPLDYSLVERILQRGDAAYVGLIGSRTKWRRFRMRFDHRGYEPAFYERVHCPVGSNAVPGKLPMEIAVSIAAQVIAHYHRAEAGSAESAVRYPAVPGLALLPDAES